QDDPCRPGRAERPGPPEGRPARRAGRPWAPRAAHPGGLRGQEPSDVAGREGQGPPDRDRRRGRGDDRGGSAMRHLLSAADLDRDGAVEVLDTAAQMAATQGREIKKLPTLRGRTVVNLFFEDSTRTRISFETAAKRLSADVINFSAKG